ncbi:hypothetical protein MHLNE_16520 [Moorella humiferrea]|uniref:DVU0298 family protein n=1 Tax=Neomoorella humiferrea TaxID=676965 RepID=UPI0030CF3BEB
MADRPLTLTPTCPFCGLPIARPKEQTVHRPNEMPVGSCPCGAVYACDLTGHNLGAAFIEALVYSCNMDWDLAWGLLPEEDYQEKVIEKYDFDTHLIVPGGFYEGRKVSGALYFIKLQPDILEVTLNGKRQKKTQALPPEARFAGTIEATRPARKYTNKEIEELVREFRVEALLDIARTDLQIIRRLQRLLYSSDALMRFRAADILGKAAAVIAVRDAQIITGLLQRLLNAVTDPGACGWGAIDAAGAIIAHLPHTFAGYIPFLYQLLLDTGLRSQTLRALGTIAEARPDLIRPAALRFLPFLEDADPATRGYAARLLGNLVTTAARDKLLALRTDSHPVVLYANGSLQYTTVGELASAALAKLQVFNPCGGAPVFQENPDAPQNQGPGRDRHGQ